MGAQRRRKCPWLQDLAAPLPEQLAALPSHPEMHLELLQYFWGGTAYQGAEDFCCELSPILQSCLPLVCFPGALYWGCWAVTGGAASSLPLGASGATTTQMTEIISLVSKLLSKLNMLLPFHKNKADALQFLSNKSVFRIVLQTGKLDFTTLKRNATSCLSLSQFLSRLSLCLCYLISSGFEKAGETAGIR